MRPANVKGCYFRNITNTLFPFGGQGTTLSRMGLTLGSAQRFLLEVPRVPEGDLRLAPALAACKASALPLLHLSVPSFLALILLSSLQRIVLQFNINKNVNNKYPPHYQIVNFVSPRSTPACSARFLKVPGCIVSQYPEQKMGICSLSCSQGLH